MQSEQVYPIIYLELEQEPVVVSFLWCFPEVLLLDGSSFGCSPEAFARERSRCLCVEWGCAGLAETVADTGGLAVAVDVMPLVPAPSCANAPPPLSTELLATLPTLMLDLTPRTWLLVLLLVALQAAPPCDFESKISKCHAIIEIHRAKTLGTRLVACDCLIRSELILTCTDVKVCNVYYLHFPTHVKCTFRTETKTIRFLFRMRNNKSQTFSQVW